MLDEDYQVLEACDGNEAIDLIREHVEELSLILLDIVMPGMDGFQVLNMMNRYHWTDSVPVIVISADDSNASINKCYKLGATDYIRRPFDYTIVSHRVANTITLFERQNRLIHLKEGRDFAISSFCSCFCIVFSVITSLLQIYTPSHYHTPLLFSLPDFRISAGGSHRVSDVSRSSMRSGRCSVCRPFRRAGFLPALLSC